MKGEGAGISEELAAGCGWVEMVGKMSLVSVAANDQVFAVGTDDRLIYYRSGVCVEDLTGKRWKALRAPLQVSRASSNASLNRDKFHKSLNVLVIFLNSTGIFQQFLLVFSYLQSSRPSSLIESSTTIPEFSPHSAPMAPTSLPVGDLSTKYEIQPKNPKAWSPVHSVGSIVGTEVHPEADESIWSDSSRESCIFAEDEELGWAEYEAPWSWVEAGACTIDTTQLPNWFGEGVLGQNNEELEQAWRKRILNDLKTRLKDDTKFKNYELAIDTTSWAHNGEARCSLNGTTFVDCILQLEWVEVTGSLTILNPDGCTTMVINL